MDFPIASTLMDKSSRNNELMNALQWIRKSLSNGSPFSAAFAAEVTEAWAFHIAGAAPDSSDDVDDNSRGKTDYDTRADLTRILGPVSGRGFLLAENMSLWEGHPGVHKPFVFSDENLLFWTPLDSDDDSAWRLLNASNSGWVLNAFVVDTNPRLVVTEGARVSSAQSEVLAARVTHVIVSVFDGDAFLVAERPAP